MHLTRRGFLGIAAGAAAVSPPWPWRRGWAGDGAPVSLSVSRRAIEVNGRPASVFRLLRADGGLGMTLEPGARFRVRLDSDIDEPTLVHWHGQTPPNAQDGVPHVTQPPLAPGRSYAYDYAPRPGTHWMHAHFGLQEQELMAAPLIVRTADNVRADVQEIVLLLHDFTFHDPEKILADLKAGTGHAHGAAAAMSSAAGDGTHGVKPAGMAQESGDDDGAAMGGGMPMAMDLNDVAFDAYLANDRTLDDPEVVRVDPGGRLRLRVINAASSTNFVLDTGALAAEVIAVDGNPVVARPAARVPLAMAQRVDLLISVPAAQGAWPVLALREGAVERTGIVLATKDGRVSKLSPRGTHETEALGVGFEAGLRALAPPTSKAAAHARTITLTGAMRPYAWGLNGKPWGKHDVIRPEPGERVELTFVNKTMMSHPMHLHGHHFQVVEIDGHAFAGAVRDTVLVPANGGRVRVAFDADNPGRWVLHCHNLYHMVAGMMTEVRYGV